MRFGWVWSAILVAIFMASIAEVRGGNALSPRMSPLLSIEESIELVRPLGGTGIPQVSPDKSRIAAILEQGNVETNTRYFMLVVFDANRQRALAAAPASPLTYRVVATAAVRDTDGHIGISHVKWAADSSAIYFIGRGLTAGQSVDQLFRTGVDSATPEQLTQSPVAVRNYSIATGDVLLVTEEPRERHSKDANGYVVGDEYLQQVVDRIDDLSPLWRLTVHPANGAGGREIQFPGLDVARMSNALICPNGKFALAIAQSKISSDWINYPNLELSLAPGVKSPDASRYVAVPILLDLQKGQSKALVDAPAVYRGVSAESASDSWAAWSEDCGKVVVAGLFDPRDRSASPGTFVVDIANGRTSRLPVSASPTEVAWRDGGIHVAIADGEQIFAPHGGRWVLVHSTPPVPAPSLRVNATFEGDELQLYAANGVSNGSTRLNPVLATRTLGKTQRIEWTDKFGRTWPGMLAFPPGYTAGKRLPLAIGTKVGVAERRNLSGINAIPVQELLNRGLIYLQLTCEYGERPDPSRPIPHLSKNQSISACYDAAIEHLDEQGLIDRERVGILGFSSSGQPIQFSLSNSDHVYAAASIVDSYISTPYQYSMMFDGSYGALLRSIEAGDGYDGPPVGASLESWLNRSAYFSLDRVQTPVRYEYHGLSSSIIGIWDVYALSRRIGLPVELANFPYGQHDLVRPQEILLSQLQVADWFDFWLNDHQRTELHTNIGESYEVLDAQYRRWKILRKQRDSIQAQARPPVREWSWRPRSSDPD